MCSCGDSIKKDSSKTEKFFPHRFAQILLAMESGERVGRQGDGGGWAAFSEHAKNISTVGEFENRTFAPRKDAKAAKLESLDLLRLLDRMSNGHSFQSFTPNAPERTSRHGDSNKFVSAGRLVPLIHSASSCHAIGRIRFFSESSS